MTHVNTYLTVESSDPTNTGGSAVNIYNSFPRQLEFDPLKQWEVALVDITFEQASGQPVQSVFVYSDIVQASIIGSQHAQLLRRVLSRSPGTREDVSLQEPLHFRPISTRNFSSVKVELRDSTGALITTTAAAATSCVLAFRVRHPDN